MDVEDPHNFPKAKRVLTVIRSGVAGKQIWAMMAEANETFGSFPPMACFEDEVVKKLHQYCSGRFPVFVHPSLYRALKLTFSLDIDGLSPDGTIKTKMGTGSMGEAVGVLTPSMFNAREQH